MGLYQVLCFAGLSADASVSLSSIFGSHMVLQRNKLIPVYGTAAVGESITVTFNGQSRSTTADAQGNWQVMLPSMPASTTARTMTIQGTNRIDFTDVLIGDVWVTSGQSNMDFRLSGCDRQTQDVNTANYPLMRQFYVPPANLVNPTKYVSSNWSVCSPSTAGAFGAVGFYFARELLQELSSTVPIGLFHAPRGATAIDPWLAPEGLTDIPALYPLYSQSSEGWGPFSFFNGTIYPIAPYAFTGVIWYQGESRETTTQNTDSYFQKQRALQQGWKRLWGMDDMPFYIVLIANYLSAPTGTNVAPDMSGATWADTRIQQMNMLGLPHGGVASALDIGDAADIHPKDKLDVGERLALWALKNEYGRSTIVPSGPVLRDVTVSGNKAICLFDYVGAGLMVGSKTPYQPTQEVVGGMLARFSIAGATGGWYDAVAVINGNTVELTSPSVTTPKKVAYACWTNPAGANLYNRDGLPAAPFYVDDISAKYTITASAGTGGTISPAGTATFLKRKAATYSITPDSGYYIQDVLVDGVSVGAAVKTYTFDPLYANHTIQAVFAAVSPTYTVTASAAAGGSISPSGAITLAQGATQEYDIIPNPGVQIAAVTVDGGRVGNRSSFTFTDVRTNHTISATAFVCPITASPGYGGSISPAGTTLVPYGNDRAYTIAPNPGFNLVDVKIDGVSKGPITSYTFNDVITAHSISATFTGGEGSSGCVPKIYHLLFSAVTDSLPASGNTGNWATYIPSGKTLTAIASPTVETINGVKWEKNVYTDNDAYTFGSYTLPINCQGCSVVMAVRPVRNTVSTGWTSCVDAFYDRLVLGIKNNTGQVVVRRNGSLDNSTATIPDGQATILSIVVQPTGQYRVYANGTRVMDITTTSDMTSLVPLIAGSYAGEVTVGRNAPDGWTTFNGNIGDVFFYTTALTDAERQQLEAGLTAKFIQRTITATAGPGGTISPSGAVKVNIGASRTFIVTPNAGYGILSLTVDGTTIAPAKSYTFTNVTANHIISAEFAKAVGVNNKAALTDSKLAGRVVRVWGKVAGVNGVTSFTIRDGYNAGLTIKANGLTLPGALETKSAVVTGLLARDTAGNVVINAQDISVL